MFSIKKVNALEKYNDKKNVKKYNFIVRLMRGYVGKKQPRDLENIMSVVQQNNHPVILPSYCCVEREHIIIR